MQRVLYISQQHPNLDVQTSDIEFQPPAHPAMPTQNELLSADIILFFGGFATVDHAQQIAGLASVVMPTGSVIVLAHERRMGDGERAFLKQAVGVEAQDLPEAHSLVTQAEEFSDYFAKYGRSYMSLSSTEDMQTLATIRDQRPAALCISKGLGALYVLPYHFIESPQDVVSSLLRAIHDHRFASKGVPPAFLSSLRLHGEDDLLEQIAAKTSELKTLENRAKKLEGYRMLVGHLSGQALEDLIIESLNLILEGSGFRAEDRPELHLEDFWILQNEEDFALAEAKGIGSHVRRIDVNQVDNNRSELHKDVSELPGLLVVNIFRGDSDVERRELPVSDDVVRHAVRQNVLVLRTIDLYRLVSRRMASEETPSELAVAMQAGGGWLEVKTSGVQLRQGS